MSIGGALATYGAAQGHMNDMEDMDTRRAMIALEKERLTNQVRIMQLRDDAIRAASRRHHAVKAPVPAAPAAMPAAVAGAGGVTASPALPGVGSMPGTEAEPYANGGLVGGREGKFDGIFDASKWDNSFSGLPTLMKSQLHGELGHHPDDPHFLANVANSAREQHFANGGMAGAPPFPGFNNGGAVGVSPESLAMKDGGYVPRAGMDAQAQADMMVNGKPAQQPQAPQSKEGGVNFFNGASKPQISDEERRRRLMEAEKNRPPTRRADGGPIGGALDADGGLTHGPGTTTSDSIPARLSKGEFVIPADVVAKLGSQHFQKLIDKYHTEV